MREKQKKPRKWASPSRPSGSEKEPTLTFIEAAHCENSTKNQSKKQSQKLINGIKLNWKMIRWMKNQEWSDEWKIKSNQVKTLSVSGSLIRRTSRELERTTLL